MGTRRASRLSDSAICAAYRANEARDLIAMRAGLLDREILEILRRNGVQLRDHAQSRALAAAAVRRHFGTLKLKRRAAG